jgi:HrpA-like RNA helicase
MKEKNDTLFAKFNNNQLKAEYLTGYFKSLSILGKIYYGDQLPITQHLEQFEDLLKNNNIVLVKAGTGSGKSTVIPPYLIGVGYSKVVVTQPRRLPCR